jgi:hypothetical protein
MGNIKSIKRTVLVDNKYNRSHKEVILKKKITYDGRHEVSISPNVNKIRKSHLVHKLILWTFRGFAPEGMECRHLDGNPQNNKLTNLVWGTKLENSADRRRHGQWEGGEGNGNAKLTKQNVYHIREYCNM